MRLSSILLNVSDPSCLSAPVHAGTGKRLKLTGDSTGFLFTIVFAFAWRAVMTEEFTNLHKPRPLLLIGCKRSITLESEANR